MKLTILDEKVVALLYCFPGWNTSSEFFGKSTQRDGKALLGIHNVSYLARVYYGEKYGQTRILVAENGPKLMVPTYNRALQFPDFKVSPQ